MTDPIQNMNMAEIETVSGAGIWTSLKDIFWGEDPPIPKSPPPVSQPPASPPPEPTPSEPVGGRPSGRDYRNEALV